MKVLSLDDVDIRNKRVLIREDFNVPIEKGRIVSYARIKAALPTIRQALKENAAVILISHLGRPPEGRHDYHYSLALVAEALTDLLEQPVHYIPDWLDGVDVQPGQVVLCENVRFNLGEKANDDALAKRLANLADVFVMDAFASAHRAHASTHGVAKYIKTACAGPLLLAELEALEKALTEPEKPLLAIVGGAKVSTKLQVLLSLVEKVDTLIVGGGIANTFMAAKGYPMGSSLYELDCIEDAKKILARAEELGVKLPIPEDVVVSTSFTADADVKTKHVSELEHKEMVLDIGPETAEQYTKLIARAKTILWNGPVGVFEYPAFACGTKSMCNAIASNQQAFSIAGGGDTIAALEKFKIKNKVSYISTAGGAFLEFVEGKTLPAIEILMQRAKSTG